VITVTSSSGGKNNGRELHRPGSEAQSRCPGLRLFTLASEGQGYGTDHHEEFQAQQDAAEKKKKTTITAESFDRQVAYKMGDLFSDVFLPTMIL
jgi:hypothetical protein